MDYHTDRFQDFSLIAYQEEMPIALLPANRQGNTLHSHQGLTFGGWITDARMKAATMLQLFDTCLSFLKEEGIDTLVYKSIPYIYHTTPSQEDIYALFRHNTMLARCEVTTTIDSASSLPFSSRRRRGISKAKKAGISIREDNNYEAFFLLLAERLQEKYETAPTHTCEELTLLAKRFPQNIRLFTAYNGEELLAGVVIYESEHVAHAQYIASNENGRKMCALDGLFDHLIHTVYPQKHYFDFGSSNERQGQFLNEGLIQQKEEFGARAVAQCTYQLEL